MRHIVMPLQTANQGLSIDVHLVGHPLDQWNPETYVKKWVLKRRKKRVIFTTRGCFLLLYTGGVAEIDHEALNGVN